MAGKKSRFLLPPNFFSFPPPQSVDLFSVDKVEERLENFFFLIR